jgi:hypothetical protein
VPGVSGGTEERRPIARELHEVIAHNVSVMVVQATAAEDRFDHRPEQAREALRSISSRGRATGRATLRVANGSLAAVHGYDIAISDTLASRGGIAIGRVLHPRLPGLRVVRMADVRGMSRPYAGLDQR